jgi:hypothetical protein
MQIVVREYLKNENYKPREGSPKVQNIMKSHFRAPRNLHKFIALVPHFLNSNTCKQWEGKYGVIRTLKVQDNGKFKAEDKW